LSKLETRDGSLKNANLGRRRKLTQLKTAIFTRSKALAKDTKGKYSQN